MKYLEQEVVKYREWIKRRVEREPLEYIIGYLDFLNCSIFVYPGVLIPRRETEILASLAIKEIPKRSQIVWDLCTGSGCIGLSLKKKCPELDVTLSDLCEKALACARKNAQENAVDVTFIHGDLLTPFDGKKADIVICNPPYVAEDEYKALEDEVRFYEPKEALVGGMSYYKRLAHELPHYLNPGAKVFLEIGANQAEAVHQIFDQTCWKQRRCKKDWAGLDRFFFLEFQ